MLPKPQSRVEDLLLRVINNDAENIPIPQSRLEVFLKALITNEIDNLPSPQSRNEMILYCILKNEEYNYTAQSRMELFLKAILDVDIEGLPTPMSRIELFLDYIVRNGCLEKYEYYPFNIWSYLNVKNTPKAKMRFKGMKGNTLVNELDTKGTDKTQSFPNNLDFQFDINKIKLNTVYTAVVECIDNKCSGDIRFSGYRLYQDATAVKMDGMDSNDTVVFKSGEKGIYTRKFGFKSLGSQVKVPSVTMFSAGSTGTARYNVMIIEGDYTQNPPPYFENMKSFGDGPNKIEVLSTGKNLFYLTEEQKSKFGSSDIYDLPIEKDKTYIFSNLDNARYDLMKWNKGVHVGWYVSDNVNPKVPIKLDSSHDSVRIRFKENCSNKRFQLEYGYASTEYQAYQSSKVIPMYRNATGELVPVPTLRGKWEGDRFLWGDEIKLHDDGNLYYHKRTYFKKFTDGLSWYDDYNAQLGENLISFAYDADTNIKIGTRICSDKYNEITSSTALEGLFPSGSKNGIRIKINKSKCTDLKSLDTYIRNNNFSVVVELTKEEVYPCELSEQLYSYDGETNIFINGGAVVGETVIEVGTKLGPIVAEIKQETLRNARAVEGLLAHGVQEMAYQLYPEDFNKDNTVEMKPIEPVE